jgi:hypothetical protein
MGMLVYGGSIAGLPLTICLGQQSTTPIAVEGSPGLHDGGYMLSRSDPGLPRRALLLG